MSLTIRRSWLPIVTLPIAVLGAECSAQVTSTSVQTNQNCGTVSVIAQDRPTDPAALNAEKCFQSAYTACVLNTTLTFDVGGTDLVSETTFTLQKGAPCGISGVTQTTIVPARQATTSFTCTRLIEKDGGLLFLACGKAGDIFIPPPRH